MTPGGADLARIDAAIERIEYAAALDGSHVSFGVASLAANEWDQIASSILDLFGKLERTICNYAWVRTPAGLTVVSYAGDMRTAIARAPTDEQIGLHTRALTLALDYRTRLTRLLIASIRTLSALTAAAAYPVSAVAAAKAAWQLIEELRAVLES